jgi:hypothetical protein
MSGSVDNPHVLDDSDLEEAPHHPNGTKTYIEISSASDVSSHSPPPNTKILPLRDNARSSSSSLKPPTLKSLHKRTSLRSSSGSRTPQYRSSQSSPAAGSKISLRSSDKLVNDASQTKRESPATHEGNAAPDADGVQGNDDEMEGVEKSPSGPRTRSRQDSLDGSASQESFERSIGSTSPLLIRLKEQRSRTRNSTSNPQVLPTPQRKEKPRQDISDDGVEPDQEIIAKIEHFLVDFQQKMLNDHATTARWMLHDARMAVKSSKPKCVDDKSPFASLSPVEVPPGSSLPESVPLVKMESNVSVYL